LVLSALVAAAAFTPPVKSLATFPRELRLPLGEEERLRFIGLPLTAVIRADRDGVLRINDQASTDGCWRVDLSGPLALTPVGTGRCTLDVSLFGFMPVRQLSVEVVPRLEVIPGGQSIGILLRTKGVTVAGHAPVEVEGGESAYPARDAGVRVGDVILEADGVEVKSSQHIVFLVNRCAREQRPVPLLISRDGRQVRLEVTPMFSQRERIYQMGLYVRDGAAGVGTLTFCDPSTKVFVALGHVISDATTNQPLEVSDGRVVRAAVARITPGRRGEPGEKEGTFVEDQDVIGTITANTDLGLVGVITHPDALGDGTPLPLALAREVAVGAAQIRTVVDGNRVQSFSVEITRVDTSQAFPSQKGITLRITDPVLLETTGGIVQGMSGSPIIQNGRLVGAVTHVFVNDPTRGYGVFAEWMVRRAGLTPGGQGLDWPPPIVMSPADKEAA